MLGFGIGGAGRGIAAVALVFELCEAGYVSTCWVAMVWHPAHVLGRVVGVVLVLRAAAAEDVKSRRSGRESRAKFVGPPRNPTLAINVSTFVLLSSSLDTHIQSGIVSISKGCTVVHLPFIH